MKKIFDILSIVLCSFLVLPFSSCKNSSLKDEKTIISLFTNYAAYDDDGNYRFRKDSSTGNLKFSYCFTYNHVIKQFNCNVLVTSNTNIKIYDYAAVTFSWGNFKNGLFYAYHELDDISKIEFTFSNLEFNKGSSLGNKYTYLTTKNTFQNLTTQQDKDIYAANSFKCLQQAVSYAKSVLTSYNISIQLF